MHVKNLRRSSILMIYCALLYFTADYFLFPNIIYIELELKWALGVHWNFAYFLQHAMETQLALRLEITAFYGFSWLRCRCSFFQFRWYNISQTAVCVCVCVCMGVLNERMPNHTIYWLRTIRCLSDNKYCGAKCSHRSLVANENIWLRSA